MPDASTNGASPVGGLPAGVPDDAQMIHMASNLVVMIGLAMTNLLNGGKFDKKGLAADLDPLVQEFANMVLARNEAEEVRRLAGGG